MKWQANFVDEYGKVVHTACVEAKSKREACRVMEKDVSIKKALQQVAGRTQVSYDFYIYPVTTLN